MKTDVIIIGAGAAGLSCAKELQEKGIPYLLFEALDQVGGRMKSHKHGTFTCELGAEFLHGAKSSTMNLCNENGISYYNVDDHHLFYKNSRLAERDEFFDEVKKISQYLPTSRDGDISIADFLQKKTLRLSPVQKNMFQSYVEGFHAADTKTCSSYAIGKAENTSSKTIGGVSQFRLTHGYEELLECLKNRIRHLHLSSRLIKVNRNENSIRCEFKKAQRSFSAECKVIVLTVPLGVLKSSDENNRIDFSPELPALQEALHGLEMGAVYRINFLFKERFWHEFSKTPVSFFHGGPENYFPTWWTQMPLQTPLLIAWQGGPKAFEMSLWSEEQRIESALKTLSLYSKKSVSYLKRNLVETSSFDWVNAPHFKGAYSYEKVTEKPKHSLQTAFQKRIFIAGEATEEGADRGTVHGAFNSGLRVAKKIERFLQRSK